MLTVKNHSRDSAGMKYVYPVISRRAGGVSVGINLNVNNACNWACIYCQVPDLKRGAPPPVDLHQLEMELTQLLEQVTRGDFLEKNVPENARQLIDIAFSGNGEPTSAPEFPAVVELTGRVLTHFGLANSVKLRLITNGSLMHREYVRQGIRRIGELGGEIWFKVDRGSSAGILQINRINLKPETLTKSISLCSRLAPTWIQSCFFAIDDKAMDDAEFSAYLKLISSVRHEIQGVHLYGLARAPQQPEGHRLSALSAESLDDFARKISALDIKVVVSP